MNDLCSIELLQNAVARGLSAEEETALHAHLEHCEACCAQMEQLAGGEAWQQEAAALLSADELDAAVPEPANWSEVDFSVEHLDPSDDANVLGQLGGYDVLAIVGRGGMGVVLKAFDRELKRLVAIKALAPHLAHSSVARKRFAREAQAAAAVVNPHVIAIHHVQPTGRLPFLIMPLLTGESLAQRLKARGPLELTEVLRIGMQAATGLAAAHDQGLVHRDVKPANIFLEKGVERVVITDFGLARAADDVSMTRMGVVAGTPEYMSPEQARGEALDGRSDLFSLGCVLYEMATGVSPFRTDSTMATLRRIVDEQPAAMASLVPELPPWFCHIVERLLSKDPAQRFASASEVSQLLEQCLSHLQQPTSVPLPASLVPHATGRRSIFKVTRKAMTTNLYAEKNGVRQLLWLRIILFSAIAPGSLALIAIPFVGWSNGALWMMAAISWGAFAGGLVGAAKSVPLEQQTAPPSDYRLVPHAAGRRSIFKVTRNGVLAMLGTIGMTLLGMVLLQATEAPDISGQWTSDEWGTVVLEAKQPGQYEGTFSGPSGGQPATGNAFEGWMFEGWMGGPTEKLRTKAFGASNAFEGGVGGPAGIGVGGRDKSQLATDHQGVYGHGPLLEPVPRLGGISGDRPAEGDPARLFDGGALLRPAPNIAIRKGESGTLHLKWSRLERRFNGTWGKGADRRGAMSLRLVDNEIRGGWTTDEDVQLESGTPLLGDLSWKRSGFTRSANTPRKIAPGEILVEVYGGRGIHRSLGSRNEVGKLLLSLQALKGVTVDIREDGEGDAFTKAVVHMPAHAGETGANSTKQEEWLRTVKIAIDEALRTHRVPDVRWLDGIGNAASSATGLAETNSVDTPSDETPVAKPDWVVAWDASTGLGEGPWSPQRYAMMRISREGKMESLYPGWRLLRTQLSPEELSALVALVAKNPSVQSRPLSKATEYAQAITRRPVPEANDKVNLFEMFAVVHNGELLELDLDLPESAVVMDQLGKLVGLAAIGGADKLPKLVDVANSELKRKYPDVSNKIDHTQFRFAIVDHPSGNISVWFTIDPGSKDGYVLRIPQVGQPSIEKVDLPREENLEPESVSPYAPKQPVIRRPTPVNQQPNPFNEQPRPAIEWRKPEAGAERKVPAKVRWQTQLSGAENGSVPSELPAKTLHLDDTRKQIRANIAELEELKAEQLRSGQSTKEVDAGIVRLRVKLLEVGFESIEETNRRNPKSISVPPQGQAQSRAAHVNPLVGHWKVVKLADMPVDQLAGATVVIDEHRLKMHVPSQKGPHPDWRYTLGAYGEIDLVEAEDAKGESNSRAKYSLEGTTLYLSLNAKKGDHPRPESATGEVPQKGVQYIVLELDEAKSSEASKASDEGHEKREGHQQGPGQPALSKTLKQLQGKWRLTRQIAADGDEEATPGRSVWEFNGDRIIVRDDGPGGALLIKVDESHSPVHVEAVIETDEESGLGLLKVEGDKLLLALGKRQKTPVPESRPEKLQWVSGVWYMELRRVKPGETIVPLKPKSQPQAHETTLPRASPVTPPQTGVDDSKAPAVVKPATDNPGTTSPTTRTMP